MKKFLPVFVLFLLTRFTEADVTILSEKFFFGACDASAGVALTDDLFAAADDESNHLRVYSISGGTTPLFDLSVSRFLEVDRREPEADIEGAARVGDMIYWITSHARNKQGKERTSRQRLFATRIVSMDPPKLEPFGKPYEELLRDLEQDSQLEKFDLEEASEAAPKEKNALNIEGLCARPDGSLLIGFRNPVPKKKALLVHLLNPADLVSGKASRAELGKPIRLDLDGRGVRDMVQRDGKYYIVAGAYNSADRFELYGWDGHHQVELLHRWEKKTMNPEGIVALPGRPELLILSDEGSKREDGRECKDLPAASRRFRGVLIKLAAP